MSWLDPPEQKQYPRCPVCGSDFYEYIYKDIDGRVCGCSDCVLTLDAEDYAEEVESDG